MIVFISLINFICRKIETFLGEGIVRITFTKIKDRTERVIFGTSNINMIPPDKRPGDGGPRMLTHIRMFDVELSEWRSCQYASIREVRIKKGIYHYFYTEKQHLELAKGIPKLEKLKTRA